MVANDSKQTWNSDLRIISSSTQGTFNGAPRQTLGVV
jgi:hypothetical protein